MYTVLIITIRTRCVLKYPTKMKGETISIFDQEHLYQVSFEMVILKCFAKISLELCSVEIR